jgi:O-antigen ligase
MMSRDADMSVTSSEMAQISRSRAIEIGGRRHEAACRGLVLASAGALFLHDAATVGVSYTLRISYALMALACALGLPFVIRGWRSAPAGVKLAASFLLLVYVISGLVGVNPVLAGQGRGSSTRWIVYLVDLGVGLASVGLLLGLFRDGRRIRQLAIALAVGGVVAATYGIYQWLAQRYGLPLSNVDNAPNSDNFTTGARVQGLGLLGWERVRGTFVEPFAFGIYLAAILPLVTQIFPRRDTRSRLYALTAVLVTGGALILTDSSLAWACLFGAGAVVATGVGISVGRPVLAGAAGGAAVLLAILCVAAVAEPGVLSTVTARSDSQLHLTLSARTNAWGESADIWSQRPVLGYGPGASSVKLARRDNAVGVTSSPVVLGSAYGIWASSLIDAGVFGILAWLILFGAVLYYAGSVAVNSSSPLLWASIAAVLASVLASQVGGDRLDLRVWVFMAFALLVSRSLRRHHQTPDRATDTLA